METAGIYIHIPFCKSKCLYCDFYSVADREEIIPRFVSAIIKEIKQWEIELTNRSFDTLFIGGGTPSILEPNHLEQILETLYNRFNLSQIVEITIEANPGEAPVQKLKDFRSMGINRLSVGVQSLEPRLLRFLTRIHSPDKVFLTIKEARQAGFDNINCDLIFNIPDQTKNVWQRDLQRIVELEPEHLSTYSLTVEKGTHLHQLVRNGKITMPPDDENSEVYYWTQNYLDSKGFQQYEISNFAKPEKICRHNLHYWNIDPYFGFGPSAHGFDGERRWNNVRDLDRYLHRIEKGKSPIVSTDNLSEIQLTNEQIGFGLRMTKGLAIKNIPEKFRGEFYSGLERVKQKWDGYLSTDDYRIFLTQKGMLFADAITIDLMIDSRFAY